MQISGAALLHRERARSRYVLAAPRDSAVAPVDAKCRCLFPPRYARLACLSYRSEIACTLHTRYNSTPNLLQPPSHSSSSFLTGSLPVFLSAVLSYRYPIALLRPIVVSRSNDAFYLASLSHRGSPATSSRLRRSYIVVSAQFDPRLKRVPSFAGFGNESMVDRFPVRRLSHCDVCRGFPRRVATRR